MQSLSHNAEGGDAEGEKVRLVLQVLQVLQVLRWTCRLEAKYADELNSCRLELKYADEHARDGKIAVANAECPTQVGDAPAQAPMRQRTTTGNVPARGAPACSTAQYDDAPATYLGQCPSPRQGDILT